MTIPLLAYDTPTRPTPTVWLHYVALACGLLPLVVGTVLFVMFLVLRDELLAYFGALTIFGGTCLAFIGFVCAGVYWYQGRRADPELGAVVRRRAKIDLAVIIANFPIAFGMAWFGIWLMSRVTIYVENADAHPVDQVRLNTAYGGNHDLGTIKPGESKSVTISQEDFDDTLNFEFVTGGVTQEQSLSDLAYDYEEADSISIRIKDDRVTQDWPLAEE